VLSIMFTNATVFFLLINYIWAYFVNED